MFTDRAGSIGSHHRPWMPLGILGSLALLASCAAAPRAAKAAPRPNVVWIFAEDMNAWMGCYGDDMVPTPNIDALATRGLRFDRAYMPAGVCSATRSAMALGAMQTTYGVHQHRSSRKRAPGEIVHLPERVKSVYEHMRMGGYFVSTQGMNKNDFNFIWDAKSFYDYIGKRFDEPSWQKRSQGQPFFTQIQLRGGKNSGKPYQTDPAKVEVMPYYPDHPAIRHEIAYHYNTIRQTDDEIGQILDALKADGLLESTVVFFFTDHGFRGGVRHKQFIYEGGIRVPLVVAGPGLSAGKVRSDLVSGIDISATTLGLAGVPIPKTMEGRNFLAKKYEPRPYVIAARDRCDYTIDHIRTVVTPRYQYLKNFLTDRPYLQPQYRDGRPFLEAIRTLHKEGKLNAVQSAFAGPDRPAEELYDLEKDPHETVNLAGDPKHAKALAKHRKILEGWMKATDDKGQYPESAESLLGVLKRWNKQAVNPEYDAVRRKYADQLKNAGKAKPPRKKKTK